MILPKDEERARVVKELAGDPELTAWEADFLKSNAGRFLFTDKQKEVFARLRTALVGLVGVDERKQLEEMEVCLQMLPAPEEDKAATINAVHALLATL